MNNTDNQALIDELGVLLETLEQTRQRIESKKTGAVRQALSIKGRSGMNKKALKNAIHHNVNEVMGLNEVAVKLQEAEGAILDAMEATIKELDFSRLPVQDSVEERAFSKYKFFIVVTSWGVQLLVKLFPFPSSGVSVERYDPEEDKKVQALKGRFNNE